MAIDEDILAALRGIDLSAPSTTALKPFVHRLADAMRLDRSDVYGISVAKAGNIIKQATQSESALAADLLVVVVREQELIAACERLLPRRIGPGHLSGVVTVLIQADDDPWPASVIEPANGDIYERITPIFPNIERKVVVPLYQGAGKTKEGTRHRVGTPAVISTVASSDLVMNPRIKRMLRVAIASSKAVMLVGPPGTGKTTLLSQAVNEAQTNPAGFGLHAPPKTPITVTPEEGWTTRELVGGETVDEEARLRFRPGHVLDAIRRDRWLILDEANRADMDRIFGGLLTWLSHSSVSLGRASTDLKAADVRLTWRREPLSDVQGFERLDDGMGDDIVFAAGSDWRLLGTYNALDAQRVFRFGQALGRRFARVPVPAISPEEFADALAPRLEGLPTSVDVVGLESTLLTLYTIHLDTPPLLGPALFLDVPRYVAHGLSTRERQEEPDKAWIDELVVEGYLLGAGAWLAQLDEMELEQLHVRVMGAGALSKEQWEFLSEMLPALA